MSGVGCHARVIVHTRRLFLRIEFGSPTLSPAVAQGKLICQLALTIRPQKPAAGVNGRRKCLRCIHHDRTGLAARSVLEHPFLMEAATTTLNLSLKSSRDSLSDLFSRATERVTPITVPNKLISTRSIALVSPEPLLLAKQSRAAPHRLGENSHIVHYSQFKHLSNELPNDFRI